MKTQLHGSLEYKLVLTLTLGALIFSVIAGALLFAHGYSQELDRNHSNIDNLAATVHSSASIAAFVRNDAIAKDVTEGLLLNPEILAVRIESNDGYRSVRWRNPATPEWDPDNEVQYALHSPTAQDKPIGSLHILTNAELIAEHARNTAFLQLLTLLAQCAVLVLLMVLVFRRLIGRPLADLERQLLSVQPGMQQRIEVPPKHTHSEIGLLAESVNSYLAASERAITAERLLHKRVESMEDHYHRIFESTGVGVMVLDMDGTLINCNAVLRNRILSATAPLNPAGPGLIQHGFFSLVFTHPERAWALVERARSSGQIAAADLELHEPNGQRHWVHCIFSVHQPSNGGFPFIEAVLYDVTSRREREETALRTAERDALTDVINRRGAESYIDRAIADARECEAGVTLLYLDLDGFKEINDRHGHSAGDTVLVEVTNRLARLRQRSSDLLSRMGGDEFVIVSYDCRKHDAVVTELANAIIAVLAEPVRLDCGESVLIGVSIGIACFPDDGNDRHTVLLAADQAMYQAKRCGRNRYVYAAVQH